MSDVAAKLRRILVPVDVSRDSLTALHVACDLAVGLGGEISGLFIEDSELLTAGSLPFAREVGSTSGIARRIESTDIHSRFQAVASQARDAIAEASQRMKVHTSFRIARGNVAGEILSAASDADIVVLGKAGWAPGSLRRPGRTCLEILSKSRIPVLIVERGVTLSPPILAVHDNTAAGKRALEFATELGEILGWQIVIFAVQGLSCGEEVLQKIHQNQSRLIVLPSSMPLSDCVSQLKCAVLFVP